MKPSEALLVHRATIHQIVQRHHAENPRIFGSAARGNDRDGSDLDILVDPLPGMTLFDVGGIIDELEKLLGVPVDVLTPGALSPALSESVSRDLREI
jgi:predicted nucleotidyltransferase